MTISTVRPAAKALRPSSASAYSKVSRSKFLSPLMVISSATHKAYACNMKAASPAQQGRPDHLGKRRRRVLAPQSAQGQPDAAAGADVSAATPVCADGASTASQRPAVPTELSARQLAGLFILGYRVRPVGSGQRLCRGS